MPLEDIFKLGGPLSSQFPGYEFRQQQVDAARAIEDALQGKRFVFVEAGTGVGKSLAYLIPAVRAIAKGARAVISTYTLNLQSQLMEKDLPVVRKLFPKVNIKPVVVKGRGNYLCMQELEAANESLLHGGDPLFVRVKQWSARTRTGDLAELDFRYPLWNELSSDPETCRNKNCRFYDSCFFYNNRRESSQSNLFIVNHALLLNDLVLRASGEANSRILPDFDLVIFDEAHHLEQAATNAFSTEFTDKTIPTLLDRITRTKSTGIGSARTESLQKASSGLFELFTNRRNEFMLDEVLAQEPVLPDLTRQTIIMMEGVQNELIEASGGIVDDDEGKDRVLALSRMLGRAREELQQTVFGDRKGYIRWGSRATFGPARYGKSNERTTLYFSPFLVGEAMEQLLWSVVKCGAMTSATLANSGTFSYLRSRLKAPASATELIADSPFDFPNQALLYVPGHLPAPLREPTPEYVEQIADEAERLINLVGGRTFLLFTSRRVLGMVFDSLSPRLEYPLFKQGDMPTARLLSEFMESGNGCLFGNQSFWEGVDVVGDALSCVIIDRIPFAVPDSPITKARAQAIESEGGNSFADFSIPQAQIRLKQGFGRLIRSQTDRGIVCILDTRLINKAYGKEFIKYLPKAARASIWSRVEKFWGCEEE